MSQNWLRKCTLLLTDNGGRTLDVSSLRCIFTLQEWTNSQGRSAVFKIYNLSTATSNAIQSGKFAKIQLVAGYQDNSGVLFDGEIRYSSTSREKNTDQLLTVQAVDSYQASVYATINHTLSKGYDAAAVDNALMRTYSPFGVTQGMTAKMPDTLFPRGKSFYGRSSGYQAQLGKQCAIRWKFVNGQRVSIPDDTYVNNAIVLTGETGLLGLPQQILGDALIIRCLINPNIQKDSLIQLDMASAQQASLNNANAFDAKKPLGSAGQNTMTGAVAASSSAAALKPSGYYVVRSTTCQGDTMGDDWYMELTCAARNDLQKFSSADQSTQ